MCTILLSAASYGSKAYSQQLNLKQHSGSDSTYVDKIAFYSERNAPAEIYTMNLDGSELKRLTNNNAEDQCPAFSPDGSQIAFCSNRSGNYEIYVMNNDGSNQIRLTNSSQKESQPEWSPDGEQIVFIRWSPNSWTDGDILIMDKDGSNVKQLTSHPADDVRPTWFPDGSKILFNSKRDGNYEIYTMNPDGTNPQRLTNTPGNEMFPDISPDMTKIVYSQMNFQTFKSEIHIMNADGTGDMLLAQGGNITENAKWSPDGSKILFQTDRTGNFEIFVMNADGSNPQNLTNSAAGDYWPCWGRILVPTGIKDKQGDLPQNFKLYQNYPNPFNSSTTIRYHLSQPGKLRLQIFDIMGRLVHTLIDDQNEAGDYQVSWDGTYKEGLKVSTGIYLCQLIVDSDKLTNKLILMK
jgi:Tol biopolymer transport system component